MRPNHILASDSNPLLTVLISSLEVAIQNALKNYLPRLESTSNAHAEFYDKFKHEVEDYDKEFLDKYGGDLDTTLIFVGLPWFIVHLGCDVKLTFRE